MIVRCPSNSRSASSTSGLLAPAAQTSVGRAACSCLRCLAVLPPLALPSLYTHPHLMSFSGDGSRTSKPSYSPLHGQPLPSLPWLRVVPFLGLAVVHLPWCSRCGLVNMVNDRLASEVDCTWRGRQLGPWPHTRKCLLIMHKITIPTPDSRDPPDGPPYFAKKNICP